jgi:lysozyme family protein
MNFDAAVNKLITQYEGDFSDHPDDPGGKTRFGITETVAREYGFTGNMWDLPLAHAKLIYQNKYWNAVRADELPAKLRYPVFDAAVNSGPRQAVRWLQAAAGVATDGIIGPITLKAVHDLNPSDLKLRMLGRRLAMLTDLPTWKSFGRGWARRIADIMES